MTDQEAAALLQDMALNCIVYLDDRRSVDTVRFALAPRLLGDGGTGPAVQVNAITAAHRARAAAHRDERFEYLDDLWLPAEEATAIPVAGPILDLLYRFGLLTARPVAWSAEEGSQWRATWSPAHAGQWFLSRRAGQLDIFPSPVPAYDVRRRLLLPRPGGMDDRQLEATLDLRAKLHQLVVRNELFRVADAEMLCDLVAGLIRCSDPLEAIHD